MYSTHDTSGFRTRVGKRSTVWTAGMHGYVLIHKKLFVHFYITLLLTGITRKCFGRVGPHVGAFVAATNLSSGWRTMHQDW